MRILFCGMCLLLLIASCLAQEAIPAGSSPMVRIKDIATVVGSTSQKLMGYGLVIGLDGTGDSNRSIFTAQALANMLENFDIKVTAASLTTKNIAAVIATADLPASAREGDRIDVTIASVGDASSIYGGILLPTPLHGNSSDIYALAQGPASIGGYNASGGGGGGGQQIQKNHPLTGRVIGGGSILRTVPPSLDPEHIVFTLRQPDFTTACRISDVINKHVAGDWAKAIAAETIEVSLPFNQQKDIVTLISELEGLTVVSDTVARIIVNERTGTIIIGGDVRILPCAVAHGNLTITVTHDWEVSQPPPLSAGEIKLVNPELETEPAVKPQEAKPIVPALPGGRTVVTPETTLDVSEDQASLMPLDATTSLRDLVDALNGLGVKPRDLIAVLQALKAANALQAELVLL